MIYLLVLLGFFLSTPVEASDFYLQDTILGQGRQNEKSQNEFPVNEYLGFGVAHSPNLSLETDLRFVREMSQTINEFDLYDAVLHFQPVEVVKVDFGRQFVNQGFAAQALDGFQVGVKPPGPFDLTIYSGVPRSVEVGQFHANNGLLSGLSVGLKPGGRTQLRLQSAWRKNSVQQTNLRQNDTVEVGMDVSHLFGGKMAPRTYGLFEYDTTAQIVETGTAGLDLSPTDWLALTTEFDYYDINRDTNRPTILGLFTRGAMMGGRFSSQVVLLPEYLSWKESYAYQRIEVQAGNRQNGHLVDTALEISLESLGLFIEPGYYFTQGFGGHLHGVRASIHEQFTPKFYASLGVDFTNYRKITNNNDSAFSTVFWSGYEIFKGCSFSAGAEYNRNNFFNEDVRGSFRIDYFFDTRRKG